MTYRLSPKTDSAAAALAALICGFAILFGAAQAVSSSESQRVRLLIPWECQFNYAGYVAALEQGLYAEEGLKVEIITSRPSNDIVDDVVSGRYEFGVGNSSLVVHRFQAGHPVVALAPIFQKSPFILLARQDSGISSPHDLAGRRVMLGEGVVASEAMAMLRNEGLDWGAFQRIEPTWQLQDLIDGKTDAIAAYRTDQPFRMARQGVAPSIISPQNYGVDFYGDTLFTSEEQIRSNPERVAAFRRASLAGWEYALKNPDEIIELLLSRYNTALSGYDREFLHQEASQIRDLIIPDLVKVGHSNPGRWQHIVRIYQRLGFITADVSLGDFLYDSSPARFNWNHWSIKLAVALVLLVSCAFLITSRVNRRLFIEVQERQKIEAELRRYQNKLEDMVSERTFVINKQNEKLCLEIEERRLAEEKLLEKEKRLDYLAYHDPLTDLPNRILLRDRLEHGLARSLRHNYQSALLFLDLDRFKTINDTIGHAAGDQLLKAVASRLKGLVRHSDTLARLGGDEFVIFLEQVQNPAQISRLGQKIIDTMARPLLLENKSYYLSTSIGISYYPEDGPDAEALMKCADVAMYRAKAQGGNNYQVYTPAMNARAHELLDLERGLYTCLDEEQLILHYQPQLDLKTGKLVGMEALLRWQTPERGLIPPGDFIPLAEQTGLIVAMGEWVLTTACRQYIAWQDQGLPGVRMAINISPRQFRQGDLVATVSRTLEETGMSPEHLELEITESMVMEDVEEAIATMQELADMGVALAIDDFGSGYSSLAYLKRFPISKLKIDRTFVSDITQDANDAAIVSAAIALAHSLSLETIAEGIETEAQLEFLRAHGCTLGQGFYFGRPAASSELIDKWGRVV